MNNKKNYAEIMDIKRNYAETINALENARKMAESLNNDIKCGAIYGNMSAATIENKKLELEELEKWIPTIEADLCELEVTMNEINNTDEPEYYNYTKKKRSTRHKNNIKYHKSDRIHGKGLYYFNKGKMVDITKLPFFKIADDVKYKNNIAATAREAEYYSALSM